MFISLFKVEDGKVVIDRGAQDQAARAAAALLVVHRNNPASHALHQAIVEADPGFKASSPWRWVDYMRGVMRKGEIRSNREWEEYRAQIKQAAYRLANRAEEILEAWVSEEMPVQ